MSEIEKSGGGRNIRAAAMRDEMERCDFNERLNEESLVS